MRRKPNSIWNRSDNGLTMTDNTTEEHNEQPQFLSQESLGERLRKAREAAELSRGEIALHLRLSERKIQALEEDNYELFPSETFVSGYLRSYAKALGLSEADFVRPVSTTQTPPTLAPSFGKDKQASSMDLPVRMVTYVIIVVVIISLGMWWIGQREKGTTATDTAMMPQEATNQAAISAAVTEEEAPQLETADVKQDDALTANTDAAAAPEAKVAEPVSIEAKPAQQIQQDPAAPPSVMPPRVVADESSATTNVEEETIPAPPPLTADMPRSKLVLEYQQDSWTEVDDNAGRRLVYGLMRAGQTLELKGEAPFKVFLGFAEGVVIHYNNALFDHSAFQRGEIARFRVGRAEDNQLGSR